MGKSDNGENRAKADRLLQSWDERDERYRRQMLQLSDRDAAAIRSFRQAEANTVAIPERWSLMERISEWSPPSPVRVWRRGS